MANYDISEYGGRVFMIGDVHGDIRAVLRSLALTGCVNVSPDVLEAADVCHSGVATYIDRDNKVQPSGTQLKPIKDIKKGISWKHGCNHIVTFLGDILDNRGRHRWNPYPPNGECGTAGGEMQILEILVRLHAEAKLQGGHLLWVLGNHDIANAANTEPTFCRDFAPQQYVYNNIILDTCDGNKFSAAYMELLRAYMRILRPVAVARFHSGGGTACIACHGGIDCGVFDIDNRIRGVRKNVLIPGAVDENIEFLNALYDVGVTRRYVDDKLINKICSSIPYILPEVPWMKPSTRAARICARSIITSDKTRPRMPHWCRPKKMTAKTTADLLKYFGAGIIMKGHDVKDNVHCLHGDVDVQSGSVLQDGTVCFTDIRMGRSFWRDFGNAKPPIHIISVSSVDRGLKMKVL